MAVAAFIVCLSVLNLALGYYLAVALRPPAASPPPSEPRPSPPAPLAALPASSTGPPTVSPPAPDPRQQSTDELTQYRQQLRQAGEQLHTDLAVEHEQSRERLKQAESQDDSAAGDAPAVTAAAPTAEPLTDHDSV